MKSIYGTLFCLFCFLWLLHCDKTSTEPQETVGSIQGTVVNLNAEMSMISPAYIFFEDSLLTTTDEMGVFSIATLEKGDYPLTCSALGYRDTTMQVTVQGGQTTVFDFPLTPDATTGRVLAEFQDMFLFAEVLAEIDSLANWSDKEMFEGVTGATLQSKTLRRELPERRVFLGDSLLAISDDFGQCWFNLQIGTYPVRATCDGYEDTEQVIRVLPDEKNYVIFFLDRELPVQL